MVIRGLRVVDPPREPGPVNAVLLLEPAPAATAAPPRAPVEREVPPRLPRPRPRFGAPSAL